ncbi:integrase [Nostoc sp. FACHB-152]|uniref:integrase n=1 Tax=unclassified Nostoc TaxID=2593658 RepID=UPI001689BCE5|nr:MULTISPECIES: integrase [unclassified Nostoc]MBD2449851.1 integrase [Nostoc sp. FACHB-152]MBD2471569.1 integrase [Nostoc sp. FACHB-145]
MPTYETSTYDPRKAEWDGIKIDQWEPSKWKQWKAKQPASDESAKIEREYLRIKYVIGQTNSALSLEKVKVKLKLTSHKTIGLQGTFPCRPGEIGKKGSPNKQYTISCGFAANDTGIKMAVLKARELDLLLITKQFQWTPELLGKQAQKLEATEAEKSTKLISELIQEYEQQFWKTHEQNRQGIRTWETHYLRHLKKLPQDLPMSAQALEVALERTKPNTSSRFFLVWQLKKFCEFCGIKNFQTIYSYATPKPTPTIRKVPTDEEIIQGFIKIGSPLSVYASRENLTEPEQWQWAYGMLATYGLRPHELFAVDIEAFIDSTNTFHLVTLNPSLTEGTKTGERSCGIPPIHPHWIELFDLKKVKLPYNEGTLSNKTAKLQIKFRNAVVGFKPYDLRHAYALRGHRLRVPIKTMADYMGHTVQEHTKTYQRWMNEDANLAIYKEVVIHRQGTTKEALQDRIKELEAKNIALKAENATLKGLLVKHQLGELLNQ